jgi:ABC-type multidrug transport system fused ATPase/permease subunit
MKDGQVLESGTHKELLKLGGGYAGMYEIQAGAFREDVE